MDFKETLARVASDVNQSIKAFFDTRSFTDNDAFVRHYYDTIKKYIMFGGKRLRPFLLIETFSGISGSEDERIFRPSLSVEFLHNASLIHDDIIDRDDTRRGNPAFHYLFRKYYEENGYSMASAVHFGTTMGILGGDSTFFLGLEALQSEFPAELNQRATMLYCKAYHEICEGVLMEMNFVQLPRVTEAQYMQMISLKTAALIEKSMAIGAAYARAAEKQSSHLSEYALNLGRAFQLKDDILGSFGDPEKTGKPIDGDIKDGKKTLLLIKALDLASAPQRSKLESIVGKESITGQQVQEVRDLFAETGAKAYCIEQIKEYTRAAIAEVDAVPDFNSEQASLLKSLVMYNETREK